MNHIFCFIIPYYQIHVFRFVFFSVLSGSGQTRTKVRVPDRVETGGFVKTSLKVIDLRAPDPVVKWDEIFGQISSRPYGCFQK